MTVKKKQLEEAETTSTTLGAAELNEAAVEALSVNVFCRFEDGVIILVITFTTIVSGSKLWFSIASVFGV